MSLHKSITVLFYCIVAAFLVRYLRDVDWSLFANIRLSWSFLFAGLVVGIAQRFLFPAVWVRIVESMGGHASNYPEYSFIYAKAWLGRYLPGKIALIAARQYFAEKLGARRAVLAASTAIELASQIVIASMLGLIAMLHYQPIATHLWSGKTQLLGLLALASGTSSLLLPAIFNRLLPLALRLLRSPDPDPPRVERRTLTTSLLGAFFITCMQGLYVNLLASSVVPAFPDGYFFIWGTYCIAGVMSMVFVFAPGGVGVREAIHIPLLSLVLPKELALTIVIVVRLAEFMIDVAFYAISYGARRGKWRLA